MDVNFGKSLKLRGVEFGEYLGGGADIQRTVYFFAVNLLTENTPRVVAWS